MEIISRRDYERTQAGLYRWLAAMKSNAQSLRDRGILPAHRFLGQEVEELLDAIMEFVEEMNTPQRPKEDEETMRTYETTFSHSTGPTYEALEVPWEDITEYLGRPHEGTPEDDRQIARQLYSDGAPEWVLDAGGYITEERWGLIGPELPSLDV